MAQKVKNTEAIKAEAMQPTFELIDEAPTGTAGRNIPGAIELNTKAQAMARDLLKAVTKEPELIPLATQMQRGEYLDAVALIEKVFTPEELTLEALNKCSEDELARLLESRRSDRSKSKKKGLGYAAPLLAYIAAVIAEMLVRKASGREYAAPNATGSLDLEALKNDQVALNKKIRSLQSKQSNLKRQGAFAPDTWEGWKQLEEVKAQIAELTALRTNTTTRTVTAKVPSQADIAQAIANMSEEDKLALIAQLQAANG